MSYSRQFVGVFFYPVLVIGIAFVWQGIKHCNMRKQYLLLVWAFMLFAHLAVAQNQAFPNAIHAKINFNDYGIVNGNDFRLGEGFEFAYFRNVSPFLNVGIPFKLGLAKLPLGETATSSTVTLSLDAVVHFENTQSESKLLPYGFAGAGYFLEKFESGHLQIPFGGGIKYRVSEYAFLNGQVEYRKALVDDRDNIQLGLGFVYLLHNAPPKVVDADGDGVPDAKDKCPNIAGASTAMGCPDMDKDGVADTEDQCPTSPGPAETKGCPDSDNDGVADSEDQCPDAAGKVNGCPDTDGDGIPDKDDKCPLEMGRFNGCPDKDFDGVADNEDECPDQAGTPENKGCPEKPAAPATTAAADTDGDGVPDSEDLCPSTAGKLKGCPDSDNDGIADMEDECPDQAGKAEFKGCPKAKDSDNDGTPDAEDMCPGTYGLLKGCPDGDGDGVADKDDECPTVFGATSNRGCPEVKDRDGDGFEDKKDECPDEAGSVNGCPDRDNDGVADKNDRCPDQAGISSNGGCPEVKKQEPVVFDSDGDGVTDDKDRCPGTPGPKSNNGCPEVRKETKEQLAYATKAVQFETAKAILKNESYAVLDEIVTIMRQYPDYTLSISGHTDDIGNDERNLELSQQRAKACYDYLIFRGIKTERLRHAGFGENRPIAENTTASGRELNRRVEFELILD